MAERHPGDRERPGCAVGKGRDEGGEVVVGDRLTSVTDRHAGRVTERGAQRNRPVLDEDGQRRAFDGGDRTAQLLAEVDQVAAQVAERSGAARPGVAPACRRVGVRGIVAPVPAVEVQDLAQRTGADLLTDCTHGRRPAVGEAAGSDLSSSLRRGHHGLRVRGTLGERLLAQHVLARGQQSLRDLAVQVVGHHDAHGIDVVGPGDRLPARLGALEAVPLRGVRGELGIDVSDRNEPDRRRSGPEHGLRGAVGVSVTGRPCPHRSPRHRPARSRAHRYGLNGARPATACQRRTAAMPAPP